MGKRKKRRQASIRLDGSLFAASSFGSCVDATVVPFLQLCSATDLFTVTHVCEDAQEAEALKTLETIGAFDAGLRRHRVMFASTADGVVSMIRQLQPAVHIEASSTVAENLTGKIDEVRLLGSETWPTLNAASSAFI